MSNSPSLPDPGSNPVEETALAGGRLVLPATGPSGTSPSRPMPELESVTPKLPAWNDTAEAIHWFVHVRAALKSVVYRYCDALRRSIAIFTQHNATQYSDYQPLTEQLNSVRIMWKMFASQNDVTPGFLESCVVSFDFNGAVKHMKTPRTGSKESASEMRQLRDLTRGIIEEACVLQGLIEEANLRLAEEQLNEENVLPQLPAFSDLPVLTTIPTRSTSTTMMGNTAMERIFSSVSHSSSASLSDEPAALPPIASESLGDTKHEADSEGNKEDDDEEEKEAEKEAEESDESDESEEEDNRYYPFKVRLPDELDLTQFDAVWTNEDGYPGDVPEELKDYLEYTRKSMPSASSNLLRLKHMLTFAI